LREAAKSFIEWYVGSICPVFDRIPYDLGHSVVFWVVAVVILVEPMAHIPFLADRKLSSKYPEILEEVGRFSFGGMRAKRIASFSRILTQGVRDYSAVEELSSLRSLLWFGYVYSFAFYALIFVVIPCFIW
jgi:hypothetical protein